MADYVIILFCFALFGAAAGYNVLITNCPNPESISINDAIAFMDCDAQGSSSSSSSSSSSAGFANLPNWSVIIAGLAILFRSRIPCCLFALLFLSAVFGLPMNVIASSSSSTLSRVTLPGTNFELILNTSQQYFPEKFECSVNANGVFTPRNFYWYYDSPSTYEYIAYNVEGEDFVIIKLFDGTQTHFVWRNGTFAMFPTNRLIQPFVGETYELSLDAAAKGRECYNVQRVDGTDFYYCIIGHHLVELYEGYDRFEVYDFEFNATGGKNASLVAEVLAESRKRSLGDCFPPVVSCGCCTTIVYSLSFIGYSTLSGATCTALGLTGMGLVICGRIVTYGPGAVGVLADDICGALSFC